MKLLEVQTLMFVVKSRYKVAKINEKFLSRLIEIKFKANLK